MPPALDRLLASPSALRLLRSLVIAPELPACHTTACCANQQKNRGGIAAKRRTYATDHDLAKKATGRRWNERQTRVGRERQDKLNKLLDNPPSNLGPVKLSKAEPRNKSKDKKWNVDCDDLLENSDQAWASKLAYHDRLDGLPGIFAVWHARRRREYRLPTDDSADARFLWATFARHPKLINFLIEHAVELQLDKGETYPHLYYVVMRYWLVRKPVEALEYHHQMLIKLRLRKLPLRELARSIQEYGHTAQEALLDIYRLSNERDLYDEAVPRLIESGNITMARRWHNLCMYRNDLPSESVAAHPVVQVLTAESSALSRPNFHSSKAWRDNPHLNKALMKKLLGRDTAPVRFEDSFTARMFATRSVSIQSIIKGLTMVGVNEIGPQAVSAMAWRTLPINELPHRFEDLRAAGIALQGCVFSLALEKFAMEEKWDLVRSIINSDQHPDVYGDVETQRALLTYYLEQRDLLQARRTLAILTLFHNDPCGESWNILLRLRIRQGRPENFLNTVLEMRSHGVMISSITMAFARRMLIPRKRGHVPQVRRNFDDLRFVTRFYVTALEAGLARIPPRAWTEIVRRFAMLGRFRELRRLLLWLLNWYAPPGSPDFANLPRSVHHEGATKKLQRLYPTSEQYFNFPPSVPQSADKDHPLRILFPPGLQMGLIAWGFRAGLLPNAPLEQSLFNSTAAKRHHRRSLLQKGILSRLHWSVGLQLVVQLRELNVHIHEHTIARALQMQLHNLFGRSQSRRKANRIMERTNRIPYTHYVRQINHIWGKPLFTEPRHLTGSRLDSFKWHPRLPRRRANRRTEYSLRHALGEEWTSARRETMGGGSDSEAVGEQGGVDGARIAATDDESASDGRA